ncbi:MAG: hypothetical protein AAGG51_01485 [Cyanobacteria bacterium P01_G01_bin.54]
MKYSLGLLTGLLLGSIAPAALAQQVSQTDITGVNVWNQIPPLFDEIDAPEVDALLAEIETFNTAADNAYDGCVAALAALPEEPRRYARPNSPNAQQQLPADCVELEALRAESVSLRQEVAELEAKYADPDSFTW